MARLSAFLVAFLALGACAQFDTYYAQGVSIAARDRDLAACEALARQQYPVSQSVRVRAPVFRPAITTCNAAGQCVTTGGFWDGPETYVVDVNEGARDRAIVGCMGGRGYTLITLPACRTDGPLAVPTVMPPLSAESCAISRRGTGVLIASP